MVFGIAFGSYPVDSTLEMNVAPLTISFICKQNFKLKEGAL
jgi:hypothetical protein